ELTGSSDDSPCDVDVVREKYLEPGVLPERNNSLPPIEFSQLPKTVVQIQVQAQKESDSRKSSLDCSPMTSSQLQNTIPEPGEVGSSCSKRDPKM
ncbi:unnamed protein product, partial [Allacma fusca]